MRSGRSIALMVLETSKWKREIESETIIEHTLKNNLMITPKERAKKPISQQTLSKYIQLHNYAKNIVCTLDVLQ